MQYCARHNRRYSVGYDCPDCARDALLEQQSDSISEISARIDSGMDVDLRGTHDHSVSGTVVHKHDGLVIHIGIPLGSRSDESKDQDQELQHQFVAGIALSELKGDCLSFDEWIDQQNWHKNRMAVALQNAITTGFVEEFVGDDGVIVLKVNKDCPALKNLLPAPREHRRFLRDLYYRIATGYGMPDPQAADEFLDSTIKHLE